MKTSLLRFDGDKWQIKGGQPVAPDLILCFLSPELSNMSASFNTLRQTFPDSIVVGCSTGGEIFEDDVLEGGAVASALTFDHSSVALARRVQTKPESSFATGAELAKELVRDDLVGVFIISDGLLVNGSKLVEGLQSVLGKNLPINGGLAGDGPDFGTTYVGANNDLRTGQVAAIGFYGQHLKMHNGCFAGWDDFGPERTITKSKDNVLYELNGQPALDLYKKYLGDEAKDLPGSALLYPLKIYQPDTEKHDIVRTVVGVDEDAKSLIFAGDVPEGCCARLMVGNFDNLIAGAGTATQTIPAFDPDNSAALLVSCIGRYLLLGERTFEEAVETKRALGHIPQIGFYSYGEISPHPSSGHCDLHNQTMTITVLEESVVPKKNAA